MPKSPKLVQAESEITYWKNMAQQLRERCWTLENTINALLNQMQTLENRLDQLKEWAKAQNQ